MARNFQELRNKMSPLAKAKATQLADQMISEMPLSDLRKARGLSQKALAESLHVQQPAIAKMEQRTDMYISTMRSYVEAMGGTLEIVARFPDGIVKISTFAGLGAPTSKPSVSS